MIGRGMRLHPTKKDCLVIDFVDSVQGQSMVLTPTLLGLDPHSIEEQSTIFNKKLQNDYCNSEKEQESIPDSIKVTSQLYPFIDPFCLDSIKKDREYMSMFSKLPWARTGPLKWILPISKASHISLEKLDGLYTASIHKRITFPTFYWKFREIMKNDEFKASIQAIETFLSKEIGFHQMEMMKYSSKWREKRATANQIKALEKFKLIFNIDLITRGEAYDLITRFACNSI